MISKPSLLVLYGSQTGTAQDVAERIFRDASVRGYSRVDVMAMDDYNYSDCLCTENIVVFVCSTTGKGECPDNMKCFWRFLLKRGHSGDLLSHVRYAVFGLGDSSYLEFNFSAKKLDRRLLQLGGCQIIERGEGDEQHDLGYHARFEPWIEHLWKKLADIYPHLSHNAAEISSETLLPPKFELYLSDNNDNITAAAADDANDDKLDETYFYHKRRKHVESAKNSYMKADIVKNQKLSADNHFQDIRKLELKLPRLQKSRIMYRPADVLAIKPRNPTEKVEEFINMLGYNEIADYNVDCRPKHPYIPFPITIRELISDYLDVFSTPKSHSTLFYYLSHFQTSSIKREKLQEFINPLENGTANSSDADNLIEILDEINEYLYRPRRTVQEVMQDFEAKIPVKYLVDAFPLLREREFSICSIDRNLEENTCTVEICYGVIEYITRMQSKRIGIGTNYLKSLPIGSSSKALKVRIKPGSFVLPESPGTPVILIGPGLGIAPLKSILLHRIYADKASENYLFYGCRYREKDWLYAEEMLHLQKESKLKYFVAYSRDTKQYVQDKLLENGKLIWELISEKGAFIYLSGNSKRMPDDVVASLKRIIKQESGLNEADTQLYWSNNLIKTHRFQQETWT